MRKSPIDWTTVPVDTPVLVRDNPGAEWRRRYFAKCKNGWVFVWNCGATSWSAESPNDFAHWNYVKLAEREE